MPEQPPLSPLGAGANRFRRGNLVHSLLARLPEIAPDRRRALAVQFATAHGFDPDQAALLAEETLTVLNDPEFAPAFAPASRAEVAFLAALPELGPGAQVNGRVDRLAVTDSEVLILDYKTNRPPPAREADVSPSLSCPDGALPRSRRPAFPGQANRLRPDLDRRPPLDAAYRRHSGSADGHDPAPA